MSVLLAVGGSTAHMSDEEWKWQSDDKDLLRVLNGMLDEDGPAGGIPNPAEAAALEVIEVFGGEILDSSAPPREAGVVY